MSERHCANCGGLILTGWDGPECVTCGWPLYEVRVAGPEDQPVLNRENMSHYEKSWVQLKRKGEIA